MTGVPATYFDGRTSRPRAVMLRWHGVERMLEVSGDDLALRYPPRDFTVESRLGRGPRFVRFADGGRCEVPDSAEADAALASWAPSHAASWLYKLETSWPHVVAATLILGALGWATIHFGLPWAARRIAFALPAGITRQLGDQTLAALDKAMLKPTALPPERRDKLQAEFREFLRRTGDTTPYQIVFRSVPAAGANALALPSGVIVITDALVKLAEDDREIVGVLAHECGHIHHRHALRGVLQNSAVFVVIALVTGDVSSATAFGGALPTFLLQNRFSREFEREADAHAVEKMRAAGVEPDFLARMLERLRDSHGDSDSATLAYLRSHPPTPERIRAISGKR